MLDISYLNQRGVVHKHHKLCTLQITILYCKTICVTFLSYRFEYILICCNYKSVTDAQILIIIYINRSSLLFGLVFKNYFSRRVSSHAMY